MNAIEKTWMVIRRIGGMIFDSRRRQGVWRAFEQMKKEGVNIKDLEARRAWVRSHREDLSPLTREDSKNEASVQEKPKAGRNAPCPCGSGRKYKKCCAQKV